MRVILDLDGTCIGDPRDDRGQIMVSPRPGIHNFLRELRRRSHTLVLWTAASREWVREVKATFPKLFSFFSEIYTRETKPACDRRHAYFKDIRRVGGDILIDNEPDFKMIADAEGQGHRYIWIPTFRTGIKDRSVEHLEDILTYIDRMHRSGRVKTRAS